MLKVENLTLKRGGRTILNQIFFDLRASEILCVVGPNGSGKSSLFKALTAEIAISRGRIKLRGEALSEWIKHPLALARWRAVLPQESELAFNFPVIDVVLMGRWPHSHGAANQEDYRICERALEIVECSHLKERMYQHLSGGERRRVHLARVIAQLDDAVTGDEPALLFLDEPTANLDLKHQYQILDYARQLRDAGTAVCIVLHDLQQALEYGDRVLLLNQGRVVAFGPPREALSAARIRRAFGIDADWETIGNKQFLNIR